MAERSLLLHRALLAWYEEAKRDLPWRKTRDPYAIWLSEIMLQQTRVDTVIPYYERFLKEYPTVSALAEAPLDEVLSKWSGLGYYRRARMLHAAARDVHASGAKLPKDAKGLREIKGIGAYTAGAIASIAYGERAPLVDGNVARVLARVFAVEEDVRGTAGLKRIWQLAEALVPEGHAGAWNQALMELGATVCVPREPRCLVCPLRGQCDARERGLEHTLPRLKAKAKPTAVKRAAVVARGGQRVLLARRRADGIFGGMWEPPSVRVDDESDVAPALTALTGLPLTLERAGEVVHVLSHRRMHVDVYRARLEGKSAPKLTWDTSSPEYDAMELVDEKGLAMRGTTTLAHKILSAAAHE